MFPTGAATDRPNDSLARHYAWQIPLAVDLGFRVAEVLFLGGYAGIGFGSTGGDARLEAACTDDDEDFENEIVCNSLTLRAGLQIQYNFQPDEKLNPWIGYGFGFESASSTLTDNVRGYQETVTNSGLTFAQVSVGFDGRFGIGVGPFLEAAIGKFNETHTEFDESYATRVPIDDPAFHTWITVGLRLMINP